MFLLSKAFWALVQPGNLLLVLLCVGLVLIGLGRRRTGVGLAGFVAAAFLAIAVLPVGVWAMAPLEDRFSAPAKLPERVDGVIVLGGVFEPHLSMERGETAANGAMERMLVFSALADRYPEAMLLFTGGSGSVLFQEFKEATAAREVSARFGVPEERVVWEFNSRNTHENAVLSKALVRPSPDGAWILVTSAAHMPRAVGTFRAAGWPVIPYPTDYWTEGGYPLRLDFDLAENLSVLTAAVHEWVGLVAYNLLGRTEDLFPGPAEQPIV